MLGTRSPGLPLGAADQRAHRLLALAPRKSPLSDDGRRAPAAGRIFAVVALALLAFTAQPASGAVDLFAPPAPPTANPGDAAVPPGFKEAPSLRTRDTRTYVKQDGTQATRFYSGSINYRDSNTGTWRPINNDVIPSFAPGVAYRNAANRYVAEFPADLSNPVRYTLDGEWVSMALQGARGPAQADGKKARFRDALPGVSVEYEPGNDALKESLILAGPRAQSAFSFDIRTSAGLDARENKNGSVDFVENGKVAFILAPPVMWDSVGATSSAVDLKLQKRSGGYELTLTPDRGWLQDTRRAWPVVVDPTVYPRSDDECSITPAGGSICRAPTNPFLYVGRNGTTPRNRSMLRFDVTDQVPRDAKIVTTSVALYASSAPSVPAWIDLHKITRDWNSRADWSSADGTTSWTTPGGDFETTRTAALQIGPNAGTYSWTSANLTNLVGEWVAGRTPNRGVMVKARQEASTAFNLTHFVSSSYLFDSYWPSMWIIWKPEGSRYTSTPANTWTADDGPGNGPPRVNAIETLDVEKKTYIGGEFSYVGPRTGSFASFRVTGDQTNGKIQSGVAEFSGATQSSGTPVQVRAVTSDGSGGWYVGGDFKYAKSQLAGTRSPEHLAHVSSSGTLDEKFWPRVNGPMHAVAVSGNNLYVGGDFTQIGSEAVRGVAKLDKSNGAVDPNWKPDPNDTVRTIAVGANGNVYIGGEFTQLVNGTVARSRIAELNGTTGAVLQMDRGANAPVNALAVSGTKLFVGGEFTTLGGTSRARLGRINLTDGQPGAVDVWQPNPNGDVDALELDGTSLLYVGGAFSQIQGNARNGLARFDQVSNPKPWDPGANPGARIRALRLSGSTLYVGGDFSIIGGQSRRNLAGLATSPGDTSSATSWNPSAGDSVYAVGACTSGCTGGVNQVVAGGRFSTANGVERSNLAELNTATGEPTNWNPSPNGKVNALELARGALYVGGDFSQIAGANRTRLAFFITKTGELNSWNPNSPEVKALHTDGSYMYVGVAQTGAMTDITHNGKSRRLMGAFDLDTGELAAWNPRPFASGSDGAINDIETEGEFVFFGGRFDSVYSTVGRRNLASATVPSGTSEGSTPGWIPEPDGIITDLAIANSKIYVAGRYTHIAGIFQPRLSAYGTASGGLGIDNEWRPQVNGDIEAIDADTFGVYIGGEFSQVGGLNRDGLAALGPRFGNAVQPFDPRVDRSNGGGPPRVIEASEERLLVGGEWNAIGTRAQTGFASFASYGYLVEPGQGHRTRKRLTLRAETGAGSFQRVRFEARAVQTQTPPAGTPSTPWETISNTYLRDEQGQTFSSSPLTVTNGKSPTVVWDVPPTPIAKNLDSQGQVVHQTYTNGDIEVRAVFIEPLIQGDQEFSTEPVKFTLDQDAPGPTDPTVSMGPGTLDLLSGNYRIMRDDVKERGYNSDLTFTRTYNSRNPATDGPLGPGWTTSLPVDMAASKYVLLDTQTFQITDEDDEGNEVVTGQYDVVTITSADGTKEAFTYWDGVFYPEPGSDDLWLTRRSNSYLLEDVEGNETVFELRSGVYVPVEIRQPGQGNKTTLDYGFNPHTGKPRVLRMYAPGSDAAKCGISPPGTPQKDCRYLNLFHAADDNGAWATGTEPGQWGNYPQRLAYITLWSYNSAGTWGHQHLVHFYYDTNGLFRTAVDLRVPGDIQEQYWYSNGRITSVKPHGQTPWNFAYASIPSDPNAGRLRSVSRAGLGTQTVAYQVPISGSGAPHNMSPSEIAKWGQQTVPTDSTAIFQPQYSWTQSADTVPFFNQTAASYASIHYMDRYGRETNLASPYAPEIDSRGNITTTEYDSRGNTKRELTSANRLTALNAGSASADRSRELDTQRVFSTDGVDLLEERGPMHEIKLPGGEVVSNAREHTINTYDGDLPTGSAPMHLLSKETVGAEFVQTPPREDEDIRTTEYDYFGDGLAQGVELRKPTAITVDPGGKDITTQFSYSPEGLVLWRRMPNAPGGGTAHTITTKYYSAGTDPDCGSKGEWANLPCRVEPVAQPSGSPALPIMTFEYNRQYRVTKKTELIGGQSRTTETDYDPAGRLTNERVVSQVGDPVPELVNEYSTTNGQLFKTTADGTEIKRYYDELGRLFEYHDSDDGISRTLYDQYGRAEDLVTPKGTQHMTYEARTSQPTTLLDSISATPFSAMYDGAGRMVEQTLPNGLKQKTTYDPTGTAVSLKYEKPGNVWLTFDVKESIHGQWMSHDTNVLSDQDYTYDAAGRLTRVEDTSNGSCTAREYAYDDDSNRLSKTTRQSTPNPDCQGSPTTQNFTYDAADRLQNGAQYDNLGRVTQLPAALAGSQLTTTYYVNDLVRQQTQDGITNTYDLDPMRRQYRRVQTGSSTGTEIYRYSDDTDAPAWIEKGSQWTRMASSIGGDLGAIQSSDGTAQLQLTNLHGDVVATASLSSGATGPLDTFESDEFGIPKEPNPPKYAWLGGKERRTELKSGVVQMGVRSYVPQIGRFLQVDLVAGGSANAYDYANGDPVNSFDLDGLACTSKKSKRKIKKRGNSVQVTFTLNCTRKTRWHAVATIRRRQAVQQGNPILEPKCPSDPFHKGPACVSGVATVATVKDKGKGNKTVTLTASFDCGTNNPLGYSFDFFGLLYWADEKGKHSEGVKTPGISCGG